jgi:hypothetical protein
MPIVINELPVYETTLDFGKWGTLTLRYRPVTGAEIAHIAAAEQEAQQRPVEGLEQIFDIIVQRIIEWDIVDANGQPLPVTRETLVNLPVDWIIRIYNAINARTSQGE